MKRIAILSALVIQFSGLIAQDFGRRIGDAYVRINADTTNAFHFEDDSVSVEFLKLFSNNFEVSIENKLNNLISINWNRSYWIIDGETSKVLLGETMVIDKQKELAPTIIAPSSKVIKDLYSLDHPSALYPIISGGRSQRHYKKEKSFSVHRLVLAFDHDGIEFIRGFDIYVTPYDHVREIERSNRKTRRKN